MTEDALIVYQNFRDWANSYIGRSFYQIYKGVPIQKARIRRIDYQCSWDKFYGPLIAPHSSFMEPYYKELREAWFLMIDKYHQHKEITVEEIERFRLALERLADVERDEMMKNAPYGWGNLALQVRGDVFMWLHTFTN